MKRVFALMLTAALLLGASAAAEKRKVEPLLLPMPLYNQHDYAEPVFTWNERDVTVEESGCGAACVAMVVGYFEPDDAPEPDDVMSLAGKLGLYRGDGLGRDALRLLLDEYGGKVPDTMEALLKLPGVGRKTANLVLGDIYKKPGAVVADTHCIRISGRLGLTDGTKDPVKVEQQLRPQLPPEESNDFCHRLVLHGRAVCMARKPDCERCNLRPWCDFYTGSQP